MGHAQKFMFGYNNTKIRGGEGGTSHKDLCTHMTTLLTSTTMVAASNNGSQVMNND